MGLDVCKTELTPALLAHNTPTTHKQNFLNSQPQSKKAAITKMMSIIGQLRKVLRERSVSEFVDETEIARCDQLTTKEVEKNPKRFDVINHLLDRTENKQYLEIGVRNPADCFDRIKSTRKFSVDPGFEAKVNQATYKFTSDEFFKKMEHRDIEIAMEKFGVIFLDGLHLADQVYRDIENCLRILDSPGFLILHDCNPPTHYHAREDYLEKGPAGPYWNGTTWKAFVKFRENHENKAFVIDTDWGVGVICSHLFDKSCIGRVTTNPFYEFKKFEETRMASLNLIDFSQLDRFIEV